MYREHFGLTSKPFSLIPDPEFLHMSPVHRLAFSMLEYGVHEQTGITVITGEVGSGKTTLIRHLLNQIKDEEVIVGLINNTHESLGELAHWIALAFEIDTAGKDKVELYKEIQDFVIAHYALGFRILLIVDEAQNMSESTLEELRLFTNINSDQDYLLQIILVGQPELNDKLTKPELRQIAQRVSVEYHIPALDLAETESYIRHRVKIAGGEYAIFDEQAIAAIFYHSGGIPRLINTLCDYALVHAYALEIDTVDLEIAMEVVKGRKIGGVNRFVTIHSEIEKVREDLKASTGLDIAVC